MIEKFAAALAAVVLLAAPATARCANGANVSWYGEPQKLPDGSRYNPDADTCAHRTHPFGTILRIEDLDTGLGADCAVNDRGPNEWTHCSVDVSRRVAQRLGIIHRGIARAKIRVVRYP